MLILIAPKSETSDAVRAHLVALSASGIVRPFVWWSITPGGPASPSLDVDLVAAGSPRHVSLAQALDDVSTDAAAFLACYPLGADDSADGKFAHAVLDHLLKAQQVVAFQGAVRCTMVIVPARVGQVLPRSLVRFDWLSTVFVAPEDRRDPAAPNFLAAHTARHSRHAAHALAVLGDLFVPRASTARRLLDELPDCNVSSDEAGICVVRTFSRIVDGGDWYDRIARTAVSATGDGWPNPNPAHFERVDEVDGILDDVARAFMIKHSSTLGLTEVEPLADQPAESLTILAALRALLRHAVRALRQFLLRSAGKAAGLVVDWSAGSIERVARLVGADEIIVNRWKAERRVPTEEVATMLDAAPPTGEYGPASLTWRDLLDTCFALVDGSPLPDKIDSPHLRRGDRRVIIASPVWIAPEPSGAADRHPSNPATDVAPTSHAIDEGSDAARGKHASVPSDTEPAADEATHAWERSLSLDSADAAAQACFLRRVGGRLVEVISAAETATGSVPGQETPDESAADAPPGTQTPTLGVDEKVESTSTASAWRGSLIGTAMASTLALGFVATAWLTLDVLPRIGALILIAMLWVLSVGMLALRAARWERDEIRRLTREHQAAVHAAIVRSVRRNDVARLTNRFREFLDWSEIAGWFVHCPLTEAEDAETTARDPVDPAQLPMAGQLARPADPDHLARVAAAVRRDAFSAGWLGNHFREVSELVMTDVNRDQHLGHAGENSELPDPFADTSMDPVSPKNTFIQAVRRGTHRHLDGSRLGQVMLDVLGQYPVSEVVGAVRVAESTNPTTAAGDAGDVASDAALPPDRSDRALAVMDFLALDQVEDPVLMLPDHWCTPGQRSEQVVLVLPAVAGPIRTSLLRDVTGPPQFHQPMHLAVTRTEVTAPVVAGQLTSFQATDATPVPSPE